MGLGAVPVLYFRRDGDHVAGLQASGGLALLLIPALALHAQQQLTAALGGVVASACLATAGDQFDQALIQYVRQHHDLLIGARTAQAVKEAIGQVAGEGEESAAVKGRCLTSGLPRQITLTAQETTEAFAPVAEVIVAAVHRVLERTPPELAADVAESGLLLTGGGSLLRGLDTLLAQRTGMEAHVAAAPIQSVALGLLETLPDLSKRKEGVLHLARRQWSL